MALLTDQPPRHCDYCGEVLRGRADKRFCNAECRNGFHNHHAAIDDAFMREVNKVLRRNRRILAKLTPTGKDYASRTRLEDQGFNFKYATHMSPSRDGKQYVYVYDQGYLEVRPNYFLLVRRSEDGAQKSSSKDTDQRPDSANQPE